MFRTLNVALLLALTLPLGACESTLEIENAAPRVTFFAAESSFYRFFIDVDLPNPSKTTNIW